MVKLTPTSSPRLLLLSLLLALPLTNASAGNGSLSDGPDITKCDDSNGTYTSGSTYQQNLNTLFTQMTTSDISFGFYNSSLGQAPDVVYLISLCLGNFPITDCRACLSGIVEQIDMLCPNQKNAVLWAGKCMLRYSKYPMIGKLEEYPPGALGKGTYFPNVTEYIQVVHKLLRSLPSRAAAGNSSIKFAYAQADFNSEVTIYSAAQCTPDLTHQDCLQCLDDAVVGTESVSLGERGARYNFPSCYVRYEEYMFYWLPGAPPPAFSPPASSPASSTKGIGGTIYRTRSSKRTRKIILAAAVAGSLCVLLIASFIYICIRKRELYQNLLHINKFIDGDDISKSLQFKFSTTRAATGNFSEDNKLGQGGFGAVYKGRLPDSGQEIAVKRLAGNSSQGEAEFKNEIKLLAKLQHKNLVRLLGFCFHNKERLLIYEFVPNASLDHFLFDATRRAHLDWETRYNIIRGIARGILYLQEDSRLRIVHRDLKASNILLDAEMCPKIADFGTARLFDIHQTHSETRRIVGTYGYMAPEYALHGNFSTKSDVYSFGILLLEIVCGKRCSDIVLDGEISRNLISLVWRKWNEGTPLDIVDSAITNGIELEIIRCINIGLLCVQDNVVDRPTMSSVLQMMSNEDLALPLPLQPASIILSNMRLDSEHVNSSSIERSIELESITELLAR